MTISTSNNQNILSPALQNAISKTQNSQTPIKTPTTEENKPQKINKKKLACTIAAAVGVTAIAAGLIYFSKGKKSIGPVKNFVDCAGNKINDVDFKNGRAFTKDGSGFSGVLNSVSKSGDKFEIEYKDGFVIQSLKNGELLKKFENLDVKTSDGNTVVLPREKGTRIFKYEKHSIVPEISENTYYNNGKIRKTANSFQETTFHPDGKINSERKRHYGLKTAPEAVKTLNDCSGGGHFVVYDKNGKLIQKTYENEVRGVSCLDEYLQDGTKKTFYGIDFDDSDNVKLMSDCELAVFDKSDEVCPIKEFLHKKNEKNFTIKPDSSDSLLYTIIKNDNDDWRVCIADFTKDCFFDINNKETIFTQGNNKTKILDNKTQELKNNLIETLKKELKYAQENNIWQEEKGLFSQVNQLLSKA